MTRTQATIRYLEASHQAFKNYDAVVKQASDVRQAALDKASETYEAAKKKEEVKS